MLIRYEDLKALSMTAADGTTHPVRDVFVSEDDLRAHYVVIDVGGWFSNREAVVGLHRFREPDVGNTVWPSDLREDEIRERPAPEDAEAGRGTHQPPAALLGPVGGAIPPSWIMGPRTEETGAIPAKADPKIEGHSGALRSVGDLLDNTQVEARDGNAGLLMSLIFDTADWRLSDLVIETGGTGAPEHQRVVPASLIERIDWQGRAIELNCPISRVHDSPDLHEMDGLAGKWYNKVLAYYGLQS